MDRIDNADYHSVDGQAFGFGSQPGARALGDQNILAFARAYRIDGHQRTAGGHIGELWGYSSDDSVFKHGALADRHLFPGRLFDLFLDRRKGTFWHK